MLPEERAREKIDKQLINAGWDIVSRNEYVPKSASAVKEGLIPFNVAANADPPKVEKKDTKSFQSAELPAMMMG